MDKNQKPKTFLVLKIIGFSLMAIGIIFLIVGLNMKTGEFSDQLFNPNYNRIESIAKRNFTIFGGLTCIIFSLPILFVGFSPEIKKVGIKTNKYLLEDNKEDLTDIANTTIDISENAIKRTASAIKEGISDGGTVYCKHCGQKIDEDSKFCRCCGKEQ